MSPRSSARRPTRARTGPAPATWSRTAARPSSGVFSATGPTTTSGIRRSRREGRRVGRHALGDLDLEDARGVVVVPDERVDARPVDEELAPVDAHRPAPVEHRERRTRLVRAGVGTFVVGGLRLEQQPGLVLEADGCERLALHAE